MRRTAVLLTATPLPGLVDHARVWALKMRPQSRPTWQSTVAHVDGTLEAFLAAGAASQDDMVER